MTERVLGPTGGRRRKRLAIFVPFFALAALILAIGASAGPVSTASGFQGDDGNLVKGTSSDATECGTAPIDWNCFKPVSWNTGTFPYRSADKVALVWEFKGIEDDQAATSDTAFAGGTKQDDACATVTTAKAPNKDDLKRVYVASSVVGGDTYLALGWVRIPQNTTSASAHVAFEFNQGSTSCGSGSPLVQRSLLNGGDMLVVYDFEGGAETPTIKILRWKNAGTCEQTGKSAATTGPCWVKTADATAAGFAEAKVNVGSSALDELAPPVAPGTASVSETLGDSEFGEAIINLTDADVFPATATNCFTLGKVFAVSRSSGNSGQAQMKDLDGPGNISISNCGSVVVKKVTKDVSGNVITNDATQFTFSTNVHTLPGSNTVANFNLTGRPSPATTSDTKTISDVKPESARTVTESLPAPSPYALVGIACTGGSSVSYNLAGGIATFTIAADETVTCTFTNQIQVQPSTIATAQTVYPNDSATVTGTTGGVTFELFGPFADAASVTCSSGAKFTQTVSQVSGVATTTNYPGVSGVTAYGVVDGATSEGWYGWRATAAVSTGYEGRRSSCDEKVNIQITDYAGTGVKFP